MKNSDMPVNANKVQDSYGNVRQYLGLTKREHFAGLAMQGLLASNQHGDTEWVATSSLLLADALLAELEKSA